MPSFLSKVFVRKRDDKDANKRSSVASLLEGKFEAVSPSISPSATHFPEAGQQPKEKERDNGFSLFRAKSRPHSPSPDRKPISNVPHLTLNLPVPKEEKSRALGVVFEADPDDHNTLPDNVIGERRLNPLETLLLVKACGAAIVEHGGLETLGVMHPHWYSASPDLQRKLISLFILSLSPTSPVTTLSPTPTSTFDRELEYTRSPHDIAAVLRWALRHLRLEGDSFGSGEQPWQWYGAFLDAERAASYPPSAFSEILLPQLPATHLQLLVSTLEIVSSLGAHSERNGISGSKLAKVFGLWLLMAHRTEDGDDWSTFYSRWERAGRMLEHLFLAQIRDEMMRRKMPLRLSELVASYPYNKGSTPAPGDDLLSRPRLSTRRYDALFVRIDTQLPDHTMAKPKQHPLRLIADAVKSEIGPRGGAYDAIWDTIKKASAEPEPDEAEGYPALSRVFTEETIRLLSLIPAESSDTSPTFNLPSSPIRSRPTRRRSTSLGSPNGRTANGKADGKATNGKARIASEGATAPGSPKDWTDFSTLGFGDSSLGTDFAKTLLDSDLEVTTPPASRKSSSKKRKASPTRSRRSSVDNPVPPLANRVPPFSPKPAKSTLALINVVQLDEAFVDFWSDALLDPIAADWPNFVVCQLKPLTGLETNGKPIGWLILEQAFTRPPPPPESQPISPTSAKRASSPRPSLRSNMSSSRKSSTFSTTRKRFAFFGGNAQSLSSPSDGKATRKAAKSARIGEMGEILAEEEEKPEDPLEKSAGSAEPKGLGLTGVNTSAPTAIVAAGVVAAAVDHTTKNAELPPVPVVEAPETPAVADHAAIAVPIQTEPAEKLTMTVAEDVAVPADASAAPSAAGTAPETKALPPAPEPVVLTGETPGPEMALSTSEPATLAQVSTDVAEAEASSNLQTSVVDEVPESQDVPEPMTKESAPLEERALPVVEAPVVEVPPVPQDEPEPPTQIPAPPLDDAAAPVEEVQEHDTAPVVDETASRDQQDDVLETVPEPVSEDLVPPVVVSGEVVASEDSAAASEELHPEPSVVETVATENLATSHDEAVDHETSTADVGEVEAEDSNAIDVVAPPEES